MIRERGSFETAGILFVLYLCYAFVIYLCSICALYVLCICVICAVGGRLAHSEVRRRSLIVAVRRRSLIVACSGPRAGARHHSDASNSGRRACRAIVLSVWSCDCFGTPCRRGSLRSSQGRSGFRRCRVPVLYVKRSASRATSAKVCV